MNSKSEEEVRMRAYELWELEGCPNARDKAHWYRAEKELLQRDNLTLAAVVTTSQGDKRPCRPARVSKTAKSRVATQKQRSQASRATQVSLN